ncbi:MAG: tripartite tricarboxylate transporter substrate binding protein [Hyphomicrobiaceae bacterium]
MTKITRRTFTSGTLAAASGLGASITSATAQDAYPAGRVIKIIVPFPAAGATDIVGRLLADRLTNKWKVSVIVENVPGAGANIGIDRVAKGPTDGTQILIIPPNITTNPFLYEKIAYDAEKDIVPLSQVTSFPNLLCVRKDLAVNSVAELIAYAKANPGKLNYASSGIGTTIHLSAELFKSMTGTDMTHVPYKGSAPAVNDLLGGQVDLMFDNLPSIIAHARAGKVKPLGITSLKRSTTAPEYAPVADTVPGYSAASWFGVGVKAGTPGPIMDTIEAAVREACTEALVKERLGGLHAETIGSSRVEFAAMIAGERARWGKLIKDNKIKSE